MTKINVFNERQFAPPFRFALAVFLILPLLAAAGSCFNQDFKHASGKYYGPIVIRQSGRIASLSSFRTAVRPHLSLKEQKHRRHLEKFLFGSKFAAELDLKAGSFLAASGYRSSVFPFFALFNKAPPVLRPVL